MPMVRRRSSRSRSRARRSRNVRLLVYEWAVYGHGETLHVCVSSKARVRYSSRLESAPIASLPNTQSHTYTSTRTHFINNNLQIPWPTRVRIAGASSPSSLPLSLFSHGHNHNTTTARSHTSMLPLARLVECVYTHIACEAGSERSRKPAPHQANARKMPRQQHFTWPSSGDRRCDLFRGLHRRRQRTGMWNALDDVLFVLLASWLAAFVCGAIAAIFVCSDCSLTACLTACLPAVSCLEMFCIHLRTRTKNRCLSGIIRPKQTSMP